MGTVSVPGSQRADSRAPRYTPGSTTRGEAGLQAAPLKQVRQQGVARTGIHPLSRSFETLLKGRHASRFWVCSNSHRYRICHLLEASDSQYKLASLAMLRELVCIKQTRDFETLCRACGGCSSPDTPGRRDKGRACSDW